MSTVGCWKVTGSMRIMRACGLVSATPMVRDQIQNYRVVVMGTAGVGKSSIISKFMHDKSTECHKETIEELHRHQMKIESVSVEIDILDTSDSYSFPSMRKLAIATGDAFVLVFSAENPESSLREEIKEHKA